MKRTAIWILALLCVITATSALEDGGIFVTPIEGLAEGFIVGADVSSVLSLEASGVAFKDARGQETDLFALLASGGWNLIRVRLWVEPMDENGNGYGGGGGTLANAVEIARRAKAAGLPLLLDFHYSDFWADPGKQMAPKAWAGMKVADKADALYAYTKASLQAVRETGATVAMVQVGNETDTMLAGERGWPNIVKLMNAGSRAVREAFPEAKVAVHFSQPKAQYAQALKNNKADYDVFAVSYYPYWHGSLENLTAQLTQVRDKFDKLTLVAETAYPYTADNGDFQPNSVPSSAAALSWTLSVQGQANALRAVAQAAADADALGVVVWEPAWLPVPGDTLEAQQALWEKYGSGWASSFSAGYDPDDAGKYFGGTSWDNQTVFDFKGIALPTLNLPRFLHTGSVGERKVDALVAPHITAYKTDGVTLPDSVDALYTDGSVKPVGVTWETGDYSQLGEYEVRGTTAQGQEVTAFLSVTAHNLLKNPGFEDEDASMYRVAKLAGAEVYRSTSQNDAKNGVGLFHFYDAARVAFTVEQDVTNLTPGAYRFSLYVHGGSVTRSDMFIYVKINGETFATAPTGVTAWREWQNPVISGIPVAQGDVVTVGASVSAEGPGPWGKLDEWLLALE